MNKQQVNASGNGFQVGEHPDFADFKTKQSAAHAANAKGKSNKSSVTLQDIYDQNVYIIAMLEARGYDNP